MKSIGIDCRLINQTGVGVYIRNLLYYLPKDKKLKYYLFLINEKDLPKKLKRNDFNLINTPYRWHTLSEQTLFLKLLNRFCLELMHFTYFSYPILYKKPFIATIHDITPINFKTGKASIQNNVLYFLKDIVFRYVIKTQINKSIHIITPTNTIKNDILLLYPDIKSNKITVTYEGLDYLYKEIKNIKTTKDEKLYIYVGNFYPHKNIKNLLLSWSQIKTDKKLYLIGPKDIFSDKLKKLISDKKIKNIVWKHNLNIKERAYYYSNSIALIHPSLSEGFGLPLIEALNYKLPIIASNIPVFKELLKSNYVSFNPKDIKDIRKKIIEFNKHKTEKYLSNYNNLIKEYSFKKMSSQTYNIYKKYVNE